MIPRIERRKGTHAWRRADGQTGGGTFESSRAYNAATAECILTAYYGTESATRSARSVACANSLLRTVQAAPDAAVCTLTPAFRTLPSHAGVPSDSCLRRPDERDGSVQQRSLARKAFPCEKRPRPRRSDPSLRDPRAWLTVSPGPASSRTLFRLDSKYMSAIGAEQ